MNKLADAFPDFEDPRAVGVVALDGKTWRRSYDRAAG